MSPPAATSAGRSTSSARPATHAPRPVRNVPPVRPRRVSGPARPARPTREQARSQRLAARAVSFFRTLPDHRLVDRLVRGRAWIPVLGVLLAGLVATQVEVLKLGASMGRWIDRSAALSSRNQALQASVATLSDDRRIERLAAGMGMIMPAPTSITFLPRTSAGRASSALARMHSPSPSQFLGTLQSQLSASALSASSTATPLPPPGTSAAASSGSNGA